MGAQDENSLQGLRRLDLTLEDERKKEINIMDTWHAQQKEIR